MNLDHSRVRKERNEPTTLGALIRVRNVKGSVAPPGDFGGDIARGRPHDLPPSNATDDDDVLGSSDGHGFHVMPLRIDAGINVLRRWDCPVGVDRRQPRGPVRGVRHGVDEAGIVDHVDFEGTTCPTQPIGIRYALDDVLDSEDERIVVEFTVTPHHGGHRHPEDQVANHHSHDSPNLLLEENINNAAGGALSATLAPTPG